MLTNKEIEIPRSPRGLRLLVTSRLKKIRGVRVERHKAMKKRGIYKVFSDEIIPLSIFCLKNYPNDFVVQPVLGNQGYDAIVKDDQGNIVDYIELTLPHDGESAAEDARNITTRGYGKTDVYAQGEDLRRQFKVILKTCFDKSQKDYSDCSLVVVVEFLDTKHHKGLYLGLIDQLKGKIQKIPFKANRVYLLVIPFKEILKVKV
jgi:hypothetical protein